MLSQAGGPSFAVVTQRESEAWLVSLTVRPTLISKVFTPPGTVLAESQRLELLFERVLGTIGSFRQRASRLSVRDQTVLALFYGVVVGTDTRALPELNSSESLRVGEVERLEQSKPWPETDGWGLYWLGAYRSAAAPLRVLAFVYRPSVVGAWHFDDDRAYPTNNGHERTAEALGSVTYTDEVRAELDHLAGLLGLRGQAPTWNALALVHLKHV